jgi:hypothetical protein
MNLVAVIVWATDPEPLMARSLILHESDLCLPRGSSPIVQEFRSVLFLTHNLAEPVGIGRFPKVVGCPLSF